MLGQIRHPIAAQAWLMPRTRMLLSGDGSGARPPGGSAAALTNQGRASLRACPRLPGLPGNRTASNRRRRPDVAS